MKQSCCLKKILLCGLLVVTMSIQGCGNNTDNGGESDAAPSSASAKESETETEEKKIEAIKPGTYSNGDNSIIIAVNDDGEYNFNFEAFDDTGDDRLLVGSIVVKDNAYIGTIEEDLSERYSDKQFEITPSNGNILITSDDESLLFLCMQYKYISEVDALEEDVSEYEETNNSGDEGIKYYTDDDAGGELVISDNGDNYKFSLLLYNLTTIEGTAEENSNNSELLDFTGTDPNGNPITGTIEQTDIGCDLTFTDSKWELLKNNTTYKFIRERPNGNYKLTQGYYGFWNGDTEYIFGANPDGTFSIDIEGGSASAFHAEGDIKDSGDGTYNCNITSSDDTIMAHQILTVSVLSEDTISVSSSFKMLDNIVHGTYQYAGAKAYDVDNLKSSGTSGALPNANNVNTDLTDKDLLEDDIFSETDYETLNLVPSIDLHSNYIGSTLDEYEKTTGFSMIECTENTEILLFTDYGTDYGLKKNQCKDITFYQIKGVKYDYRMPDIVGVKDGVIVVYCTVMSSQDFGEYLDRIDVPPLKLTYGIGSSVCYWKMDNGYMGTYSNLYEDKSFSNAYVQNLADMHYSRWFFDGIPIGVPLGGD